MDNLNSFFGILLFNTWEVLAMWLHIGALQKIQEKMILQPIMNKNSPWGHVKSELDVFGVARKLMKYVV
jgi:hypothetical protein